MLAVSTTSMARSMLGQPRAFTNTYEQEAARHLHKITLGLVTDPGLPTDIAANIVDDLTAVLEERVSDQVQWTVDFHSESLPLDGDGRLLVWKHSDRIKREHGWDLLICLSELSRRIDNELVISEANLDHEAALVALPALGPVRLRHHVLTAIVRVGRVLVPDELQPERTETGGQRPLKKLGAGTTSPQRKTSTDRKDGTTSSLRLTGATGMVRMLLGMIRINRPWRLVPSLSSAFAAAAATSAFGIFYSSIWMMANSLTVARQASVTVIAVAAMITWLISYNDMWEKPKNAAWKRDSRMYNGATVLSVGVGVGFFYVLLFVLTLLAGLAIIPPGYFEKTLGQPVDLFSYISLAWLSTSMGTIAGALGSSFEDDRAIRQATYGRREIERYEARQDD
ncbi:hypothetical protein [Arthrobacter castelli]|uniref:hypothetical protein n=1 Tax=Arthrobacter castelli TaxID=271431 RepID=UPI0012DFDA18|nr:hypothetical protein [Arthrobacter castelli]